MTDKEALMELLKRFNLEPIANDEEHVPARNEVILEAKHGNVEGYDGFVAVFDFDEHDKFVDLSLWE